MASNSSPPATGRTGLSTDQPRMLSILRELAAAFDAVADLLLAESVHQLVAGKPLRAGLAADTLGRATTCPTPSRR